ncbi:acyltransferase domain-containing protein, partial [bacterium]|nr:acyltransferase domain-containing protein [bacterium]
MSQSKDSQILKKTYMALKKSQQRLDELEHARHEPLAVIGMACRFPGGANTPDKLWQLLTQGGDASCEIPEERWKSEIYYNPDPATPGTTHANRANILTEPIDEFDAPFFNISAKEARAMDPQQRLLLEVAWEAMEHAGLNVSELSGSKTGVYVGISSDDYSLAHRHSGDYNQVDAYSLTGTCFAPAAGRISYTFGFEGPCLALDTACSSSLVALHLACQALRNREMDMALVGGVNLILTPSYHICSTKLGTISPDGRCKTFDASADGYGRGEGCGVVAVKRLADALCDRDPIQAVIRGAAVNQDGKSNGLTAPNGLSQDKVIRSALHDSTLTPADIDYMEAHGTGTPLGDPIEVESIARVMGEAHTQDNPVFLGSVKINIGHLEAAAGISGLFKVILAMRNQALPPHFQFKNPNPYVAWGQLPVKVPTKLTPWQKNDAPLRAGISSFGFSGTNAHVIVEQAPPMESATHEQPPIKDRDYHILPLSAKSEQAVKELARKYSAYLEHGRESLSNICHTAAVGRSHFNHRLAVVAPTKEDLQEKLQTFTQGKTPRGVLQGHGPSAKPKIAFAFTGQGSQYVGMGKELYESSPVFREAMDACDRGLNPHLNESLLSLLYGDGADDARLTQTQFTQPAIFALEYALARLWLSWGVKPDMVMGHSIGEYAAACMAGILTLQDALCLVAARGRLMQSLPENGSMAAVFAG